MPWSSEIPSSYRDPFWTQKAASAEKQEGIPEGLLQSILLFGERTNVRDSQGREIVSTKGARTPFQIIPETRAKYLNEKGIDAYASPDAAARVASMHIKDSLTANKNDIDAAISEYFAGSDRKNWGPKTKEYHTNVKKGLEQFNQKFIDTGTSRAYAAYAAGEMGPEAAAAFEEDVNAGILTLPAGASLRPAQQAAPTDVIEATPVLIEAYRAGQLTPEQKSAVDADIQSGALVLPAGMALQAEAEPTTTPTGLAGAVTRGGALVGGGAALGAGVGSLLGGVGAIPGALAGAGTGAIVQTVGDPIVATINNLLGTNFAEPTRAMEELLTKVGVAEPRTAAERIVQSTTAGATGALGTGALGTVMKTAASPLAQGIGQTLAAGQGAQVAGGAGSGAAGQGAREFGLTQAAEQTATALGLPGAQYAAPATEIAASMLGGSLGSAASRLPGTRIVPEALQATAVQAAERADIPVMTSDITPPDTFSSKIAQGIGERIPYIGTGPVRAKQHQARIDATRKLAKEFGADEVTGLSDNIMAELEKKISSQRTKFTGLRDEVINKMEPFGAVPVPKTLAKIDDAIATLTRLSPKSYAPAIEKLNIWRADAQNKNFSDAREIRNLIGDAFEADELSTARKAASKELSGIYGAVKDDLRSFIREHGDETDVNKWEVANKNLYDSVQQNTKGTMRSVLKSGKAEPEDINKLLFSKKLSRHKLLYNNLTKDGRANARTAIIAKAVEDAGGLENLSPERFSNAVQKYHDQVGVFFRGDDFERLNGLKKAIDLTRRAGVAGAAPPTGVQNFPAVVGTVLGSIVGDVGTTLAVAGGLGTGARIYESAPMRTLLLQLSRVKAGSKEEAALVKRLISVVQTQNQRHAQQEPNKEETK